MKKFNIKDYLDFIKNKKSYVWHPYSSFGNKYKIRVTLTGNNSQLGMRRPIRIAIVLYTVGKKKVVISKSVKLNKDTPLYKVIQEVNNIADFSKKQISKSNKELKLLEIIEIILVPEEHYHKFLIVGVNMNDERSNIIEELPNPTYQFFLSELKATDTEIAYLVEITRSIHHFMQLNKLLSLTDTDYIQDEFLREQMEVEYDYPRVYIFF